ncbi:hypothetical protein D3C84_1262350 [compost metagenome]
MREFYPVIGLRSRCRKRPRFASRAVYAASVLLPPTETTFGTIHDVVPIVASLPQNASSRAFR